MAPGSAENDAAITSIVNVDPLLCNVDTINPVVTLKNNGSAILFNVIIEYGIDGGASGIIPWEGLLAPLQTANVQLPPIPVTAGEQALVVRTMLPNAQPDEVPQNDADTLAFIANLPGTDVQLLLTPDIHGADITWTLSNASGIVLYQGGPYPDGGTGTITRNFCLGDGCYSFTITDAFGDGICCADGEGSYVITSGFGEHVVSDGQYGAGEVREFCLEGVGVPAMSSSMVLSAWPNPTSGPVNVAIPAGKPDVSWRLVDMGGRLLRQGIHPDGSPVLHLDVSDLAPAIYVLHAMDTRDRMSVRIQVQP